VLKSGGRVVLMTPNGGYLWYRILAPLFRYPTRHLSTDYFMTASQLKTLFTDMGFSKVDRDYWTFIPRGDMPKFWGNFLNLFDILGKITGLSCLRGGIIIRADKS